MKRGQSLYFDLIRFLMALEVMIGHATFHGYTGPGFLWQVDPNRHLQTAIMGFFVLSGFVIAYVADTKERDGIEYASARIARMHSIIIPALLVTISLDWVGFKLNPAFYQTLDFPTPIGEHQGWRYFLSFFYINDTWIIPGMHPGTNGPFWSMTYEVMYYAMFGLIFYLKSNSKYLLVILLMAIAGPSIVTLFPIWLLGAAVYHIQGRRILPKIPALLLFIGSLVAIILLSNMRPSVSFSFSGRATHLDYLEGISFALNFYAATGIEVMLASQLGRAYKAIRWLGMLTFSLYLCHRPLLNFFSVWRIDDPTSILQKAWLFGGTFTVVIIVSYFGEWLRVRLRSILVNFFHFRTKTISRIQE